MLRIRISRFRIFVFTTFTSFLMMGLYSKFQLVRRFRQLEPRRYKWHDQLGNEDVQTSLVMPCTVGEGLTSLPMALKSITESDGLPHEVVIVFGLKKNMTLEEELEVKLPANISVGVDQARDMVRSVILKYLVVDDSNHDLVKDSIEINSQKSLNNPQPIEYLEALDISKYLNEHMVENWEDNSKELLYTKGIYDFYLDYPDLGDVFDVMPRLKVFLSVSENGWANASRERGAYEAFDHSEPNSNQIVSYVDCDDEVMPLRLKIVEQAFKENPDLHELVNGFIYHDLAAESEKYQKCPKHLEFRRMYCDSVPVRGYTEEEWEDLFELQFDFRDPKKKRHYYDLYKSHDYLLTKNDPPAIVNPWNGKEGNFDVKKNKEFFAWGYKHISDMSSHGLYPCANGHTSWRREWLINTIKVFPHTRVGEDTRLSYASLTLGGNLLDIPKPLTTYVIPQGNIKRKALEDILEWNGSKDSLLR